MVVVVSLTSAAAATASKQLGNKSPLLQTRVGGNAWLVRVLLNTIRAMKSSLVVVYVAEVVVVVAVVAHTKQCSESVG